MLLYTDHAPYGTRKVRQMGLQFLCCNGKPGGRFRGLSIFRSPPFLGGEGMERQKEKNEGDFHNNRPQKRSVEHEKHAIFTAGELAPVYAVL